MGTLPEIRHKYKLKGYGLTVAAYDALLDAQNYVCILCKRPETERKHGKIQRLSVDHDHSTGRVRGLICCDCNKMLGFAGDNPTLLLRAIQYLKGNL